MLKNFDSYSVVCIRMEPSRRSSRGKYTATEPVFDFHEDGVAQSIASGVERHRGRIWKPSKRKGRAQTEPTPSVPTKHFLTGVPETVFKGDFKPIWDTHRSYLPMKRSRLNRSNPVTGQTTLQQAAVKPVTRQKYLKHWEEFCLWSSLNRWKISTSEEVDLALTMFLEEAYLDGGDLSLGRYIVAAVTFMRPELRSPSMQKLPRTKQSLQGWRNLMPPQSRLPIPWEVTCLVAALAFKMRLKQVGVALLVAFCMYLRPSLPNQGERRCAPQPKVKTQTSEIGDNPAQLRGRGAVQDSRVRRNSGVGLGASAVLGGDGENNHPGRQTYWRAPSVQSGSCSNSNFPANCSGPTRHHGDWSPAPIPSKTWRSKHGLLGEAQIHSRNSEERTLASNGLCFEVRKGRMVVTTSQQSSKSHSGICHVDKRKHRASILQPALAHKHSLSSPCFLEVFSGSGNLSKAVARITGWPSLMWDIVHGSEYDLKFFRNGRQIKSWLRSGVVRCLHLGTPYNSFSRARDRRPGPPPLRSNSKPLGLDGLRPGDFIKVQEGNLWMRFSVQFFILCMHLRIPVCLENPATSRLWLCPAVQALMRRRGVYFVDVDFCAFHTRWRKRTRFLYFGVDLSHLSACRCQGAKRGLCAFSGKPHLPLMGTTATGEFMTKIAEPYPSQLCNGIANSFLDWHTGIIGDNFWKRLWPESKATMGS